MMTGFQLLKVSRASVRGTAITLAVLLVVPMNTMSVIAQTPTPKPTQTPTPTTTPKPGQATATDKDQPKLTADQLDSLVAPVALYPDPLLSQSLVASTYPLELIQAQQWLEKNPKLKGDELTKAVEKQEWDPSVQATAVVPDLLKRLTEDITWTHNLGNAFLEQQSDVMAAVQRLRKKAKDAGKLDSSEQQKVETKVVESQTIIEIQPTSTSVVYVPTYSPTVIWGPPMYYPYPPIYYPPYYGGAWLGFGVGIAVGIGISGGWGWGCGWGGGGNVYINNNNNFVRHNNINTGNIGRGGNSNWNHNPSHRGGAPYASTNTASKFGGSTAGSRTGAGSRPGATSTGTSRTGGGGLGSGSSSASRPGSTSSSRPSTSGGGDRVGSRSVPTTSSRSSGGFGGMSSGASRAGASSARGGGSMGGGGRR
jgi:hypothetical protein